jgi:Mg/Co/Ni transporter MgtE
MEHGEGAKYVNYEEAIEWRILPPDHLCGDWYALQVVSVWSNGLGAFLTLASSKLHLDPAMTSAPLMTTIVDTTGLVIYFLIAEAVMSKPEVAAALTTTINTALHV